MFDKLKQLKQLKQIKDALEQQRETAQENGVSVTVNGKMEVEEIRLNPNLDQEAQEKALKQCLNQAFKNLSSSLVQKMGQF